MKRLSVFSPKLILTALLLASGTSFLTACKEAPSGAGAARPAVEVGVFTLTQQPLTLSTELAGRTTAKMVAQIRPQVSGIIQQRAFVEGALLKEGDLLYQIDAASYQATYNSAQSNLARAEATLNAAQLKAQRQQALLAINAISTQDNEDAQASLQQAEADLASAKAALSTARINLDRTRITTPIAGQVAVSSVTPGALVTANQETALTTVQQLDPIYVDIPQSSTEILKLKQALASGKLKSSASKDVKIRLQLEDGTTYAHEGVLQVSGVSVNTSTGAVTLRALVPNPQQVLLPGMYVRASLEQGVDPQAILVPQQAVSRDSSGQARVWVVATDGKVEQRVVTVAEAIGQSWRVTDGLASGERVIIEGSGKVKHGQLVRAVDMTTTPASAPAAQKASAVMATAH